MWYYKAHKIDAMKGKSSEKVSFCLHIERNKKNRDIRFFTWFKANPIQIRFLQPSFLNRQVFSIL